MIIWFYFDKQSRTIIAAIYVTFVCIDIRWSSKRFQANTMLNILPWCVAVESTKKCTINNVASGGDNAVINTSASVPCNLAGYVSRGEVPELL